METIQNVNNILHSFNIKAQCINHKIIDNYYFYDLKLENRTRIKDIQKISDEIALSLQSSKPNIKILHEQGIVRLEFSNPNKKRLDLFKLPNFNKNHDSLTCVLGQKVDGSPMLMDLAQNPHLIVAGTTGSGKSILLHNLIANLLINQKSFLYLLDPKKIEFEKYKNLSARVKVGTTYDEALLFLEILSSTMEGRFDLLRRGYDAEKLPYIILIIDEFADLIMQDKKDQFLSTLCKLAQKCRAAKIHIVLSTQRPSVDIVSGSIKTNFPARISCRVASHIDSKVILDESGAENLFGKGDALIKDNLRSLERFQVAYTSADEVCSYFRSYA